MPFQFAYSINDSSNRVPAAVQWPLGGTGGYNVGDLLTIDPVTGYMGTCAAGNPGTVAAVSAGYRASGTAGQPGTVYMVNPGQIWKCITNAATYSVTPGAGSVQLLNAGTISSTPGTSDNCVLYTTATQPGDTNISAYVRFTATTF